MKYLILIPLSFLCLSLFSQQDFEPCDYEIIPKYWESPNGEIIDADNIFYFEDSGDWTLFVIHEDVRVNIYTHEIVCDETIDERSVVNQKMNIYPNPASNYLNIEHHNNSGYIRLISMDGRITFESRINSTTSHINVSHIIQGTYTLLVLGDIESSSSIINITR